MNGDISYLTSDYIIEVMPPSILDIYRKAITVLANKDGYAECSLGKPFEATVAQV